MFVQSLEYALSCLLYFPAGDMIMTLVTLIAAINYIIVSFGYKAHWDCLSYAKVGGKYCIHLFLEEIDL